MTVIPDFSSHESQFLEHIGAREGMNEREERLLQRAKKYTRLVSWVPGLRMIAVGNSLAFHSTHEDSDIDLFVVTDPRRMWLTRVLMTGVFHLFRVRKNWSNHAGRLCLSFFITTEGMDLSEVAIEDDVYLYFWMRRLIVLLDRGGAHEEFCVVNNLPREKRTEKREQRNKKHFSKLWNFLDNSLEKIFLPRTLNTYKKLGEPAGVVIDECMLKFHDQDKRAYIRDTFFAWISK